MFIARLLTVVNWIIAPNVSFPPCFRILHPCPLLKDFALG